MNGTHAEHRCADKIPTHKIPTDKIPNDFSDVFVAMWDFVDLNSLKFCLDHLSMMEMANMVDALRHVGHAGHAGHGAHGGGTCVPCLLRLIIIWHLMGFCPTPKQSHAESLDNLCAILYHVKLNFTMYCVRMSQVRLIVMGPLLPFKLLNFDASKLAP